MKWRRTRAVQGVVLSHGSSHFERLERVQKRIEVTFVLKKMEDAN